MMAILQVRDIDDRLYAALRQRAKTKHRSISQEVVGIIEKHLSNPRSEAFDQTEAFLSLGGAWSSEKDADALIDDIRKSRADSDRFGDSHGLFD